MHSEWFIAYVAGALSGIVLAVICLGVIVAAAVRDRIVHPMERGRDEP